MTSAHQSGGTSSLPSRLDLNINANEGQHRGDDVGHADVDNTQVVQRLRAYRDNETQRAGRRQNKSPLEKLLIHTYTIPLCFGLRAITSR